jgi:hypothetical protein
MPRVWKPTFERVRAKLDSGSYTTINRALAEVVQPLPGKGNTKAADLPADLMEIGRATWTIYIIGRLLHLY